MKKVLLLSILFFSVVALTAQNDMLILTNGDMIVGDLKSMDKGVVTIEPPYSDSDFKIEWKGIKEIKATQRYLITLSDGTRINGTFRSSGDGKVFIDNEEGEDITVEPGDIVYINSIDDSFLSRLSANIDFGYSLTKANNQQQINANLRMAYLADKWSTDIYYNSLITTQDNVDVEDIKRNDAGLGFRYFLPADWYLSSDITWLSNTEQSLDLRTNGKVGIGNYIIHSNTAYWGVSGGGAFNNESFSPVINSDINNIDSSFTAAGRKSFEGFIGTELNLYDIGDLNLFTNLIVYPTIVPAKGADSGRVRADFRFDAKYDDFLLKDFYIRAGYTLNYDSQPGEEGKKVDYIFTTGFGWEW